MNRRWQNVILAFCLAFILVVGVFGYWQITPFGNRSLIFSDMGTQYVPMLTDFQHALRTLDFRMFSFTHVMGSNLAPTLTYYLMSPYNLIVLLFSSENVPMAVTIIIMAKIASIAATMTWYLQRHFATTARMSLLFGVAFAFCGFVAVNYFDLMWLDALIVLPLVAFGLDQLVRHLRPAAFFWWLLASMLVNYYLGYMTCIFSVCYFIYLLVIDRPEGLKTWWQPIKRFVVTAILSGISAALVLIPTGLSMLQTAKGAPYAANYKVEPTFGLEAFGQFMVGGTNNSQRLDHAPTLFVSSAIVLLVMVFWVHPAISRRHKWAGAGFLTVLFLGLWIRLFNTFWHLMQAPAGFPFRNVFFFSFVMVILAFAAWQAEPREIATKFKWLLPTGLALLAIVGSLLIPVMLRLVTGHSSRMMHYYTDISRVHWTSLILGIIYLFITAAIIFGTRRLWRQWLLGAIVATEVAGNFILAMSTSEFGHHDVYTRNYMLEKQQMASVQAPKGQLYRVNNENSIIKRAFESSYKSYNDSLLFDFYGVSGYNSTINDRTRKTMHRLGLGSDNPRRISSGGLTPVTDMLFGVKTSVELATIGATTTTNSSYVGMGFAVPKSLTHTKLKFDAFGNQEKILQALKPSKTSYWSSATNKVDQVEHSPYWAGQPTGYTYQHTMYFTAKTAGPMYLWAPNGAIKYSTMLVDHMPVGPEINMNQHTTLINLGTFKAGQRVRVRFSAYDRGADLGLELKTLRRPKFKQVVKTVKKHALNLHITDSHWRTELTGSVTGTAKKRWLYVSLPNDGGWHAQVNGRQVTPKRMLHGMTALPIKAGNNDIRLTYRVPGGRAGILLSLIGIVAFSGTAITWRWRDKRASMKNGHFKKH
ncbi:YfhO family protein [Levilactobacillus paucivorans]|uniref:YfhO family protein n=1 Tax=Levilactobacillus paucivorans TaxID=616990 RepID=UPI001ED9B4EB|nr:YfhO family protein [Levilactobacillus paucivorans]